MREKTFEALQAAYLELLREPPGSWRLEHQELYWRIRNALADASGHSAEGVQTCMEWYATLNYRN